MSASRSWDEPAIYAALLRWVERFGEPLTSTRYRELSRHDRFAFPSHQTILTRCGRWSGVRQTVQALQYRMRQRAGAQEGLP